MTDKKDYYSILGVSKSASAKDIKDSYRRLASKHHPDKGGDETKFKEIQEAYEVLGNEDSRHIHDNAGFNNSGFNGNGFNQAFHFDFADFFNAHQARQNQHVYQANITLEDAYTGTEIDSQLGTIKIPKGVRHGTKMLVNQASIVHVNVKNHHKFTRDLDNLIMKVSITSLEAITGIDLSIKYLDDSTIKTRIPAMVKYSQSIRLAGKGMPNPETGVFGDLYVVIVFDTPTDLTMVQKDAILKIVNRTNLSI